jgi:stage II sporulation protein D
VASRSYALFEARRARAAGRSWDVHQDTRSQAYWGLEWETARTDEAVTSTRARVRTWRGGVIWALFTAANGGRTVGVRGYPYLRAMRDRFD